MDLLSLIILNLFLISVAYKSYEKTVISKPVFRLSSLQKRSLLLPNYGSVKVTVGLAKALIGNNPKGLSLSYEMCSYFDGPTVIKDWFNEMNHRPKEPVVNMFNRNRTTDQSSKLYDDFRDVYPSLLVPYSPELRNDSYTKHPFINLYKAKEVNLDPRRKFSQKRAMNRRNSDPNKLLKRSTLEKEFVQSEIINMGRKNPLKLALEYLLGTDARCCILKSICWGKEFLLPPGYSMIQDVVRIIVLTAARDLNPGNSDFCKNGLVFDCDVDNTNDSKV